MLELIQQKFLAILIGTGRNNFIVEWNPTGEGIDAPDQAQWESAEGQEAVGSVQGQSAEAVGSVEGEDERQIAGADGSEQEQDAEDGGSVENGEEDEDILTT